LGVPEDKKIAYSVGLFCGSDEKYPAELVDRLAQTLPNDTRLLLTQNKTLRKYKGHPRLWAVPVMLESTLKGIHMSDVVVYANAPGYFTDYGRTCIEALAAKRPVICENRGAPGAALVDGVHALMFDAYDEVVGKIEQLRNAPDMAAGLAATGQVFASWHDISNQAGAIKGILHSLGA